MGNKKEKLISIKCAICSHVFMTKVVVITNRENKNTYIDVTCPKCDNLLTTLLNEEVHESEITLRSFEGTPKK